MASSSPRLARDPLDPLERGESAEEWEAVLGQARARLDREGFIECLHGVTGAGKTSFLHASLVPALRAAGFLVAIVPRPDEPGITMRILSQLGEHHASIRVEDGDYLGFRTRLRSGTGPRAPVVVVIDHVEDLFLDSGTAARCALGPLMGATAGASPGACLCRWILIARTESLPHVHEWLEDVARPLEQTGAAALVRSQIQVALGRRGSFGDLELPVLGAGSAREEAFAGAIRRMKTAPSGTAGEALHEGDIRALASALASARAEYEHAPLGAELRLAVDALLRRDAGPSVRHLGVPEDATRLCVAIAERRLREGLTRAFETEPEEDARAERTRAFLLLSLVADAGPDGLPRDEACGDVPPMRVAVWQALQGPAARLLNVHYAQGIHRATLSSPWLATALNTVRAAPSVDAALRLDTSVIALRAEAVRIAGAAATSDGERTGPLADRIRTHADRLLLSKRELELWRAPVHPSVGRFVRRVGWRWPASGVALLALAIFFFVVPWTFRARMRDAQDARQAASIREQWENLPLQGDAARAAMAEHLVQRALAEAAQGHIEEALLWRVRALDFADTEEARREIAYLTALCPAYSLPHDRSVSAAAITPAGDRVLTHAESDAYLWALDAGAKAPRLIWKQSATLGVLSADGSRFAAASAGRVQVRRTADGSAIGPAFAGNSPALSPDGSVLGLCKDEKWVWFRVGAGERIAEAPDCSAGRPLIWDVGSDWALVYQGAEQLRLLDIQHGTRMSVPPMTTTSLQWPQGAAILNQHLFVAEEGRLRTWRFGDPHDAVGAVTVARGSLSVLGLAADAAGIAAVIGTKSDQNTEVPWVYVGTPESVDELSHGCASKPGLQLPPEGGALLLCASRLVHLRAGAPAVVSSAPCGQRCAGGALPGGLPVTVEVRPREVAVFRGGVIAPEDLRPDPGTHILPAPDGIHVLTVDQLEGPASRVRVRGGDPGDVPRHDHWATGARERTARWWDVATMSEVGRPIVLPAGGVPGVASSASGNVLGTWSKAEVRLTHARSGEPLCESAIKPKARGGFTSAVLSPSGNLLATFDDVVRLWDLRECAEVSHGNLASPPEALRFSPAGDYLVATLARTATLWRIDSKNLLRRYNDYDLPHDKKQTVHIGADGSFVMRRDGKWVVWTPRTNRSCDGDGEQRVALSPGGKWLVAGTSAVTLWAVDLCRPIQQPLPLDSAIEDLLFDPSGERLFVITASFGHVLEVGSGGLRLLSTRRLFGAPIRPGHIVPLAPATAAVLTWAETGTFQVEEVSIETAQVPDSLIPREPPAALRRFWEDRLGLRFDTSFRLVAVAEPPVASE